MVTAQSKCKQTFKNLKYNNGTHLYFKNRKTRNRSLRIFFFFLNSLSFSNTAKSHGAVVVCQLLLHLRTNK